MLSAIEDDVMVNQIDDSDACKNANKHGSHEISHDFRDCLNFDDIAKQMAALKAIIFHTPDTNDAKIQFLKEELAAGRYQIQSSRIAARLMEYYTRLTQPEMA